MGILDAPAILATTNRRLSLTRGVWVPDHFGSVWRPKLIAAQTGAGKATVAVMGDSVGRGHYSSNLDTKGWAGLMRAALAGANGSAADGGSGWHSTMDSIPAATGKSLPSSAYNVYVAAGNYWTVTGTWSTFTGNVGPGLGQCLLTTDSATPATATVTGRGTTITIYTLANNTSNAAWQYQIDGGSWVSVADQSGLFGVQKTTITGLSTGSHTLAVRYNDTAKNLQLVGASFENAAGVVVNNHSIYGLQGASISTSTSFTDGSLTMDWLGGYKYPCDLAIYAMGLNDAANAVTGDAWAKNLRRWLQQVRDGSTVQTGGPDVIILLPHVGKYDTVNPNYVYQDYAARARGIAEAYGCALVDLWGAGKNSWNYLNGLGGWGTTATPGAAGSDTVHPSDVGHAWMWSTVSPLVTATA